MRVTPRGCARACNPRHRVVGAELTLKVTLDNPKTSEPARAFNDYFLKPRAFSHLWVDPMGSTRTRPHHQYQPRIRRA